MTKETPRDPAGFFGLMGGSCVRLGTDTGPSADRRPLRTARSPEGRAGRFHERGIDTFENPRARFSPFSSCCIAAKCV